MAASREPAGTAADELVRQADRMIEQTDCLKNILETTYQKLGDMKTLMTPSQELQSQIDILSDSINTYYGLVNTLYPNAAQSLRDYAQSLAFSLDSFTSSVSSVHDLVEQLQGDMSSISG